MEMCYDGALVMPGSYAVMDEEEMMYVDGGLAVKRSYLDKSVCKKTAKRYTKKTGLSQMRIAKEIYAHTLLYYMSSASLVQVVSMLAALPPIGSAALPVVLYIRNHSNPINLGGDSKLRVTAYNVIWDKF